LWVNDGSVGTQPGAEIKNFSISSVSCPIPVVTFDGSTENTATFSWTGTASSYKIRYKLASGTEWIEENTQDTTFTIENLTPSSLYNVEIIANCGGEDGYSQPYSTTFRTACATITSFPYAESFDYDLGCWTSTPISGSEDWESVATYPTDANTAPIQPQDGTGLVLFASNDRISEATLTSPVLDIAALNNPTLSFYLLNVDWSGDIDTLKVYYKTAPDSEQVLLETYSSVIYSWTQVTLALPNASSTYQIIFDASSDYGRGIGIDNLVIDQAGGTVDINVVTGDATNITKNSATLNGTVTYSDNDVTAKGFEWKVTDNGTYTQVTVTGNTLTYNLTGLTPNTSYTYKAFATTADSTVYGEEKVFTTLDESAPVLAYITETLCYGESYTFGDSTWSSTGTYYVTVDGQNGDSDTLYTINLTIRPENQPINETVTINESELPYTYHGQTFTDFGTYSVTTQDEFGCPQIYNLTLVNNSGLADVNSVWQVSLYPNPTSENATLKVVGLSEQATIILTDQQGRVISTKTLPQGVETMEIETVGLASGVYYIRIQTSDKLRTEKLIKR